MKQRFSKSDILHQLPETPANTGVLFLPYQNRIIISVNYKPAKLFHGAPRNKPADIKKEWYIYAYAINPATGMLKRFIRKGGINYAHTIKERRAIGAALIKATNELLAEGWNPFIEIQLKPKDVRPFNEMIDHALELSKKKLANKSWLGYRSNLKFVKEAAIRTGVATIPIQEIKRKHIQIVFRDLLNNGISNKRYNKFLVCLKSMFTTLMDDDIDLIENDPIHGMKSLPVEETTSFESLEKVKDKIKELTYKDSFMFGLICQTLYETGIRPNEILALKWENINRERLTFRVASASAKNKKSREVPVKQSLIDLYDKAREQNPSAVPGWYIFCDPHTLLSGSKRLHRERLTERWARVVHKEGKLDKKYKMYALKHTGADDKIEAGIDLEHLKDLYGHHSTNMTRIYARKIKEKGGQSIRDQSPEY